jgi:hypothetical protein
MLLQVYGRTDNPWNKDRTPGGSSGGEGALIAARGSVLGERAAVRRARVALICALQGLERTLADPLWVVVREGVHVRPR